MKKKVATIATAAVMSSTFSTTVFASTYTVQPGDTLWDISKRMPGLTVEKIKSLNNLKGNSLKPGQKLIIS